MRRAAVALSVPSAIYTLTVGWRARLGLAEIVRRLGLTAANRRAYLFAIAASIPSALAAILASSVTSKFEGSMIAPFVGAAPTATTIGSALAYGFIATGFPEELLFRGLIAGVLFRRLSFWKANWVQAFIFMIPHLLILLVAPQLWPLAIFFPLALGLLAGWLRNSTGSIGPAVIIHAASNSAGALWVLNWSGQFW